MRKELLFIVVILSLYVVGCDALQTGGEPFPTLFVVETAAVTETPPFTVLPIVTQIATSTEAPVTATIAASPTSTMRPCDEDAGQVIEETLFSAEAGANVRYTVYLPPCYAQSQLRYPVVYMLHGYHPNPSVMDNAQWVRMGLTDAADLGYASGALPPIILVMPNGNDAGYDFDAGPFPEFVVNDLVPAIEANFCTWNEPEMRAIGGLSRGGFFAYWIAFRYADVFGRVGGHSPYFYQPNFANEENPFNIVDAADIENLAMYMDHGGFNREINEVQPGVLQMLSRLKARGITPEYVANPIGDHDEAYWASHTADYLAFYAETWSRDLTQFPSCMEPSP